MTRTFICTNEMCPALAEASAHIGVHEALSGFWPTDGDRKRWTVRFENDGTGEQVRPGERTDCPTCGQPGEEE